MVCQFTCTYWYIPVCACTYQFIPYIQSQTTRYCHVLSGTVRYCLVLFSVPATLISTYLSTKRYQQLPWILYPWIDLYKAEPDRTKPSYCSIQVYRIQGNCWYRLVLRWDRNYWFLYQQVHTGTYQYILVHTATYLFIQVEEYTYTNILLCQCYKVVCTST